MVRPRFVQYFYLNVTRTYGLGRSQKQHRKWSLAKYLCKTQESEPVYTVVYHQQYKMCVCVVIPFILDVRLVDAPAGVTQEEGRTGFLHHPSAVLAFIFLARRIQPSLSLVDREVEFCLPTNSSFSTSCWAFYFILYISFFCEEKSQFV